MHNNLVQDSTKRKLPEGATWNRVCKVFGMNHLKARLVYGLPTYTHKTLSLNNPCK